MRRLLAVIAFLGLAVSAGPAGAAIAGDQARSSRAVRVSVKAEPNSKKCKNKKNARKCKKHQQTTATNLGYDRTAAGVSTIASAIVPAVAVFDTPNATAPSQTLANPFLLNGNESVAVPLTFLVKHKKGDWLQIFLPGPPNGSTGWINTVDVARTPNRYRIRIGLGKRRITVYEGTTVLLEEPAAVGAPATPTPTGIFSLVALLKAPDPTTEFGPYAYGLNAYNAAGQELGLHGTNDPSRLGTDATAGAIQMSNEGITKLSSVLPLGTPVEIVP